MPAIVFLVRSWLKNVGENVAKNRQEVRAGAP